MRNVDLFFELAYNTFCGATLGVIMGSHDGESMTWVITSGFVGAGLWVTRFLHYEWKAKRTVGDKK